MQSTMNACRSRSGSSQLLGAFDRAVTVHDQRAVAVVKCGQCGIPVGGIEVGGSGSEVSSSRGVQAAFGTTAHAAVLPAGSSNASIASGVSRIRLIGFRCQPRFFGGYRVRPSRFWASPWLLLPLLGRAGGGALGAGRRVPRFRSIGVAWPPRCWLAARSTGRAVERLAEHPGHGAAARLGIDQGGQRLPMHVAVPARIQLLIRQRVDQCLGHGKLLARR